MENIFQTSTEINLYANYYSIRFERKICIKFCRKSTSKHPAFIQFGVLFYCMDSHRTYFYHLHTPSSKTSNYFNIKKQIINALTLN